MSAVAVAALALLAGAAPAGAKNPWLERRIMNIAHQGGEFEAPSNTMYAFKRAVRLGADMIELDVYSTADGRVVVSHDATVDRTTNGTGRIRDMSLPQVQALDAAYNFVPGRNAVRGLPASSYPHRGVRTGQRPPPAGYAREDFRIPTLEQVLQAFPNVPINIEIKGTSDADVGSFVRTAELLAGVLRGSGRRDLIVVSFNDLAVQRLHGLAPEVPTAPGAVGIAAYTATGLPPPAGTVAFQVPTELGGVAVGSRSFVERAHRDGYAAHIFTDTREEGQQRDLLYNRLIDTCADGVMVAYPSRFEALLRQRRLRRPRHGGADPCGPDTPYPEEASSGCLSSRGGARGRRLGQAVLGRTRARQRRALRGKRLRTRGGIDRYCVTGGGSIRIGYPTRRLTSRIGRSLRRRVRARAVLILTSSGRFSIKGIRRGTSVATLRRRLRGESRLRVGRNTWYVAPGRRVRLLYKIRRGRVVEVGTADARLTRSNGARKRFLGAWQLR